MLKVLGVIINLGIIARLGFQAKSCLSPEQITDFNVAQDPLTLSFVAVVALFIALTK
jgi:citrate lyase beta subunit